MSECVFFSYVLAVVNVYAFVCLSVRMNACLHIHVCLSCTVTPPSLRRVELSTLFSDHNDSLLGEASGKEEIARGTVTLHGQQGESQCFLC